MSPSLTEPPHPPIPPPPETPVGRRAVGPNAARTRLFLTASRHPVSCWPQGLTILAAVSHWLLLNMQRAGETSPSLEDGNLGERSLQVETRTAPSWSLVRMPFPPGKKDGG